MKLQSIKALTSLSPTERMLLESLKPFGKEYWSGKALIGGVDISKEIKIVKKKIAQSQLCLTKNKCTYCGSAFGVQSDDELDHFINKAKKPEFTFELKNLFVACHKCNFPTRKGQRKTFWRDHRKYTKCRFKIVHPFFDNIDKHFDYRIKNNSNGEFIVAINPLTRKAKKTISFFGLNEPVMAEYRAGVYLQQNATTPAKYQQIFNQITLNDYYSI